MTEIRKEFTVKCPLKKAWDFISDMERFSQSIPGCKDSRKISDTEHDWVLEAKVLYTMRTLKMRTKTEVLEPPTHASFVGEGRLMERLNYYKVTFKGTTDLATVSEQETKIRFTGTIHASGLGGSIVEKVASGQMEGLFQDFEKNLKDNLETNHKE